MPNILQKYLPIINGCKVGIIEQISDFEREQSADIIFNALNTNPTIIYPAKKLYKHVFKFINEILDEVNELPLGIYCITDYTGGYTIVECKEANGERKVHGIDCRGTTVLAYCDTVQPFISVDLNQSGEAILKQHNTTIDFVSYSDEWPLYTVRFAALLFYFTVGVDTLTLSANKRAGKLLGSTYKSDLQNDVIVFDIKL